MQHGVLHCPVLPLEEDPPHLLLYGGEQNLRRGAPGGRVGGGAALPHALRVLIALEALGGPSAHTWSKVARQGADQHKQADEPPSHRQRNAPSVGAVAAGLRTANQRALEGKLLVGERDGEWGERTGVCGSGNRLVQQRACCPVPL
uniref:Uncharacterized protein n=1 Tax=Tetraselmis sp. GSL018 TaxID=582737 RepID=A0A061R826_9CHLO